MKKSDESQLVLELSPLHGGSYTQLSLRGPVCSDPQAKQLRGLLRTLSIWNGYPVHVVLSVEGLKVPWLDIWCDVLATVPARHHEIEFRVAAKGHLGQEPR